MEKQDLKELGNHLKKIDDFFKLNRSGRFKDNQFQIEIFDLIVNNTYRIFKYSKKILVFFHTLDGYSTKYYDITDEQIKKLENYYYS